VHTVRTELLTLTQVRLPFSALAASVVRRRLGLFAAIFRWRLDLGY